MAPTCSVDGCERGGRIKVGYCEMHYKRYQLKGDPGGPEARQMNGGSTGECSVDGCAKKRSSIGLCGMHLRRKRLTGDVGPAESMRSGSTRIVSSKRNNNRDGYVIIKVPGHPEAKATGWALEHRVVMSDHLGRPLLAHENVHHINGVRSDNRLENLELWSKSQPWGQRVSDKVAWAKEILALYEPTYSLPPHIAQPS